MINSILWISVRFHDGYFFFVKVKIVLEYQLFVEVKMILSFGLGRWGLAKTLNKPRKAFLTESHLSILPWSMMGTKSHHTNKINKSLFYIILFKAPQKTFPVQSGWLVHCKCWSDFEGHSINKMVVQSTA